ncbi:MAG: glycosyltransferase [Candidatus Methanomethylicaceae archaeon]
MARIAFVVTPCLPIGTKGYSGLEKVAYLLANEVGKKHEVTVFAAKGSEKGNFNLVEVLKPGYNTPFLNRELIFMALINDKLENFDLIDFHIHYFHIVPNKFYRKAVFSSHGYLDFFPKESLGVVKIFARSKAHAELLSKRFNAEIDYCYNPVDVDKFKVEEKEDYLLFLSRICREKGAFNFLEIAKEFPNERFIMAGDDKPEHGADPLFVSIVLRNLTKNIEYLGEITEEKKIDLLSRAKALIVPYGKDITGEIYFEVFGIFIVEALASGTPCFVIDSGGVSEILNGKGLTEYGFVANNLDELKNALNEFLKGKIDFNPKKLRERANRFNPETIAEEYLKKINL